MLDDGDLPGVGPGHLLPGLGHTAPLLSPRIGQEKEASEGIEDGEDGKEGVEIRNSAVIIIWTDVTVRDITCRVFMFISLLKTDTWGTSNL